MSTEWTIIDHGNAGKSWINPKPARLNVVFVHGFMGDHLDTWTHKEKTSWFKSSRKESPVLLFDLLMADSNLPCNYYSVAHEAGIVSPTTLQLAGGIVDTFLRNYVMNDDTPIALIAHSFGGLASRFAILKMLKSLEEEVPVVGLLMMGTPNNGTEIARAANALGSAAGNDMRPFDESLANLNRDWTAHVVNGGDPDITASERAPLVCWAAVGSEDRVVPPASASAMASYSEIEIINKGHLALVKAESRNDPTYALISRFITTVEQTARRRDGEWALKHLTYRLRKATLRGRWVREEEEHIQLTHADEPNRLKFHSENLRQGGLAQKDFCVAGWLSGFRPKEKIDYDWEVGKGVLSESQYDALVSNATVDQDEFFEIKVSVRQEDQYGEYEFIERKTGPGWFLLRFAAPEWLEEGVPYAELKVELDSFVDHRQGWMYYSVSRTVANRLSVSFQAPFKYGMIARLGLGTKVEGPTPSGGGTYTSRVSVDRPVSIGRNIIWIYEPTDNETKAKDQEGV